MSWKQVSKRRAFLSHLALSAVIVASVMLLAFLVWYPAPYFEAVGARRVVGILVGVDLVLGPLLTLIVFRPGKPGLLFDVSTILLVQATALVYGVDTLYQERPYYLVFAIDRFEILADKDIAPEDSVDWIDKPWIGPERAIARLPDDPLERNRVLEETVLGGKPDIERRPEFWSPYADGAADIAARALPLSALRGTSASASEEIDRLLASLGAQETELAFLPLVSHTRSVSAIIEKRTAELVAIIDVDPWPLVAASRA